jgi:hypothetical protein
MRHSLSATIAALVRCGGVGIRLAWPARASGLSADVVVSSNAAAPAAAMVCPALPPANRCCRHAGMPGYSRFGSAAQDDVRCIASSASSKRPLHRRELTVRTVAL